ncbi:substrate-specific activator of APC-dependent proteolysis [Yamadazyma tenuis]|uniref:WD40 repeat-like protein n=1 Tax=Candida tenuis (strain ATCC 10573 / BCRC 21748 / CBS 615 / JCM 9827 / NBRC 10315 / NRRL Y-1498 / VKM Y-70) TaxID=590646 RepID=G3B8V3_CANTC|nr:WD40 repeat-like protein [Yamadazyma tenuis ATCC 10573]EGV61780.1 WD40 repeat-like protein [Yamadazyma tenuis ATCC 10573]WEJ93010.1 substrate-specific activator of APC-dependent proteolysis [Yamadazyma tenuis]
MDRRDILQTPSSPSRSTRSLDPPHPRDGLPALSTSPRRRNNQKSIFSDRYIPNRTGVDLQAAFSLSNKEILPNLRNRVDRTEDEIELQKEEEANRTFSTVLKNELFGDNVPMVSTSTAPKISKSRPNSTGNYTSGNGGGLFMNQSSSRSSDSIPISAANTPILNHGGGSSTTIPTSGRITPPPRTSTLSDTPSMSHQSSNANLTSDDANTIHDSTGASDVMSTPRQKTNLFTYQSPSKNRPISRDIQSEIYSLSPVRQESQKLLLSPQKKPRNISKVPYRVLDAPDLSDDFYLNLVDWGQQDILAVGLSNSVYLWDRSTQSVHRLCSLDKEKITSLSWIGSGTHLALGTTKGLVEIWDATKMKCIRTMSGHGSRVSALSWNEHILSSGSRDRSILNRDVRIEQHYVNKFEHHKQEVCGLKWNVEENKLASGGNDNNLFVWEGLNPTPVHEFNQHKAAVKAIAWSPHQRGILATGGGTADKTIKTWNTITGNLLNDVNTGSQVCNLVWSKNSNEFVSTHGYSRNQIIVWKYPTMQQICQLTGHTFRVLYLSLSPDGETIVTGAGDETLRFWNVFEKNKIDEPPSSVLLDAFSQLR